MSENQIVVYQPNETVRLDVRLENETVWLTQSQMGVLFGCTTRNIRLHIENIYSCGELTQEATRKDSFLVRQTNSKEIFNQWGQGPAKPVRNRLLRKLEGGCMRGGFFISLWYRNLI